MVSTMAVAGDGVKVPGENSEVQSDADMSGGERFGRGIATKREADVTRR